MSRNDSIRVESADLHDVEIQRVAIELIDAYARDPMGSGRPLPEQTKRDLGDGLANFPGTFVPIAWDGDLPVGIAICFLGFSTFAAKPLINIHDLAVVESHRGQGISVKLLDAIEQHAREIGCVKLTLEVLPNNDRARHVYRTFGFDDKPFAGQPLYFLSKTLG